MAITHIYLGTTICHRLRLPPDAKLDLELLETIRLHEPLYNVDEARQGFGAGVLGRLEKPHRGKISTGSLGLAVSGRCYSLYSCTFESSNLPPFGFTKLGLEFLFPSEVTWQGMFVEIYIPQLPSISHCDYQSVLIVCAYVSYFRVLLDPVCNIVSLWPSAPVAVHFQCVIIEHESLLPFLISNTRSARDAMLHRHSLGRHHPLSTHPPIMRC